MKASAPERFALAHRVLLAIILFGVLHAPSNAAAAVPITAYGATVAHGTIACTAAAGSVRLACAAAGDFVTGNGVRIDHAGASFALANASGVVAAPCADPNPSPRCRRDGRTAWCYSLVPLDGRGGYGAASPEACTSSGPRVRGIPQEGLRDVGYVTLTWTNPPRLRAQVYAIYAGPPGHLVLTDYVLGGDTVWNDYGHGPRQAEDWLPMTPPAAPAASWLLTTIAEGGGTATPSLAVAPQTTVARAVVRHDNISAIAADLAANAAALVPAGAFEIAGDLAGVAVGDGKSLSGVAGATLAFTTGLTASPGIVGTGHMTIADLVIDSGGYWSTNQALVNCTGCRAPSILRLEMPRMAKFAIAVNLSTRPLVADNRIVQLHPSGEQNTAIEVIASDATIVRNIVVGSSIAAMAARATIADNKVSGYAGGGGIVTEQAANSFETTISGNTLVSGVSPCATLLDTNGTLPEGMEIWSPRSRIVGNRVAQNCGGGIVLGGQDSVVAHNIAEDNGLAGFIVRQDSAAYNASGSTFSGNEARYSGDRRFVQRFGITTIRNGRSTPSNVKLDGSNHFGGIVGIDRKTMN